MVHDVTNTRHIRYLFCVLTRKSSLAHNCKSRLLHCWFPDQQLLWGMGGNSTGHHNLDPIASLPIIIICPPETSNTALKHFVWKLFFMAVFLLKTKQDQALPCHFDGKNLVPAHSISVRISFCLIWFSNFWKSTFARRRQLSTSLSLPFW